MVLCQDDQVIYSANYLLACVTGEKSWAQMARALTTFLGKMYQLLVGQKRTVCGIFAGIGEIVAYTDYEPLRDPIQQERWRLYGAPNPLAPGQSSLDEILEK